MTRGKISVKNVLNSGSENHDVTKTLHLNNSILKNIFLNLIQVLNINKNDKNLALENHKREKVRPKNILSLKLHRHSKT